MGRSLRWVPEETGAELAAEAPGCLPSILSHVLFANRDPMLLQAATTHTKDYICVSPVARSDQQSEVLLDGTTRKFHKGRCGENTGICHV